MAAGRGVVLPFAEIQEDTEMWPSRTSADCRRLLPGPATRPGPADSPGLQWLFKRQEQMFLPSELQSVMTTWGHGCLIPVMQAKSSMLMEPLATICLEPILG